MQDLEEGTHDLYLSRICSLQNLSFDYSKLNTYKPSITYFVFNFSYVVTDRSKKMGGSKHGLLGEYIGASGNGIPDIRYTICVQVMVQCYFQSPLLAKS